MEHIRGMAGYRGRFAPTASGPLHLGSLLTALASWLDARAHAGDWYLRIDDLDAARCREEHVGTIQRQLEAHGLTWDATPRQQSRHRESYAAALARLRAAGGLYLCTCTRARLAEIQLDGPDGPVYPGLCRGRAIDADTDGAWRYQVREDQVVMVDRLQGEVRRDARTQVGDFVVRRRDGVCGYQLACIIDEVEMRITDVVRGADLLGSTLRQLLLMQELQLLPPRYLHLPVLLGADGRKLSKQNRARSLDDCRPGDNLRRCLTWLNHPPPEPLHASTPDELLSWAVDAWRIGRLPRGAALARRADGSVGDTVSHLA